MEQKSKTKQVKCLKHKNHEVIKYNYQILSLESFFRL